MSFQTNIDSSSINDFFSQDNIKLPGKTESLASIIQQTKEQQKNMNVVSDFKRKKKKSDKMKQK